MVFLENHEIWGWCFPDITDLAETWSDDSGHLKNLVGTHILGPCYWKYWFRPHLSGKFQIFKIWYFDRNFFLFGFRQKLVCKRYQDLYPSYLDVKFQPFSSKDVEATASGRFWMFLSVWIFFYDVPQQFFVSCTGLVARSFWPILVRCACSWAEKWAKMWFLVFLLINQQLVTAGNIWSHLATPGHTRGHLWTHMLTCVGHSRQILVTHGNCRSQSLSFSNRMVKKHIFVKKKSSFVQR